MHPPSSAAVSTSTIPGVLDIFFEIFLEASSIAATPAFMSDDPRPYSRSPCVSPANGSCVHALEPSGTTSRWPVRHSGAFEGDPPARAITLVRASAYSWYSTRKPHCSRSAPACRAQSRSRPGGLTVSKRSSARVRAMASCSLMRTDDTSPIPLTGFKRTHTIPSPYLKGGGRECSQRKEGRFSWRCSPRLPAAQLPSRAPPRAASITSCRRRSRPCSAAPSERASPTARSRASPAAVDALDRAVGLARSEGAAEADRRLGRHHLD